MINSPFFGYNSKYYFTAQNFITYCSILTAHFRIFLPFSCLIIPTAQIIISLKKLIKSSFFKFGSYFLVLSSFEMYVLNTVILISQICF